MAAVSCASPDYRYSHNEELFWLKAQLSALSHAIQQSRSQIRRRRPSPRILGLSRE
jgi:hypothetical protein